MEDKTPLRSDSKQFILHSLENFDRFSRAGNNARSDGMRDEPSLKLWGFLSPGLQQDSDIALAAFAYGNARRQDLPEQYTPTIEASSRSSPNEL